MSWRWRTGNECKQLCLDIWQGREQGKGQQFENLEKKRKWNRVKKAKLYNQVWTMGEKVKKLIPNDFHCNYREVYEVT